MAGTKFEGKKIIAVNENVASMASSNIIGKLVYYTVGETIVEEKRVTQIMRECGLNEDVLGKKHTSTQAFKKATYAVQTGRIVRKGKGKNKNVEDIFRIRIFDNRKEDDGAKIVREIKKENILKKVNKFEYLGNFIYDKTTDKMEYNLALEKIKDLDYDLKASCDEAMERFEAEKGGLNRDRLANLLDAYMARELEGTRVQIHGKLWFIPIYKNEELIKMENFVEAIAKENKRDGLVEILSIPIMEEKKYVERYSREFYVMAEAELRIYQNKITELMKNPSTRASTMDAWIQKAREFLDKKERYEELFKRSFEEMQDDTEILCRQLRELEIRRQKKEADAI